MSLPSDVLLPEDAKYHGFVDTKLGFNSHWDITWSFSFALSGSQHGFCTFLTTNPLLSGGIPGQYLGYLGTPSFILDESGQYILSETGDRLLLDAPPSSDTSILLNENGLAYTNEEGIPLLAGGQPSTQGTDGTGTSGILAIAFDSTGLFALSTTDNSGVGMSNVIPNSLIVRDSNDKVVCNVALSSLDTSFFLASSNKSYQTLRFRLASAGRKLFIDYKTENTKYKPLTSLDVSISPLSHPVLYPGFTFCSPISSSSIMPSTIFLKNFHVQGNTNPPTLETTPMTPLSSLIKTTFTTISGLTANPA